MSRSHVVLCLMVWISPWWLARTEVSLAQQMNDAESGKHPDPACMEILKSASGNWSDLMARGRCQFAAGDYAQAAGSFEKAAELRPDDTETFTWLGRSYIQDRQPAKVLEMSARAAPAVANSAAGHFLLGRAYDAQDKLDDARRELQRTLEIDPRFRGAHFALGFIAWTIRELDLAEKEFRQELKTNPRMDLAAYYLAEVLEVQGRIDDAEAVISQLGREVPGSYFYQFGLGKLQEQKRQFERAVQSFRKATQIDPANPEGHYRLGLALRKLGQTAEANAELELHSQIRAKMRPGCGQGMGRMRPHLPDFE